MQSRSIIRLLSLLLLLPILSGCYQAEVVTDRSASDTVVQEKWAPSYLNGLVPATIDVSDECPNGIASAQRNFTFLNGLVSGLTLGIYLPQNITVTCAAGGSMSDVAPSRAEQSLSTASSLTEARME